MIEPAYLAPGEGNFGRLDNLRFAIVPEPGAVSLLTAAGIALWGGKLLQRGGGRRRTLL